MEGGASHYNPRTVEEVFRDFKGRRAGIIQALTTGIIILLLLLCAFQSLKLFLMGFEFCMEILLITIVWWLDLNHFIEQLCSSVMDCVDDA